MVLKKSVSIFSILNHPCSFVVYQYDDDDDDDENDDDDDDDPFPSEKRNLPIPWNAVRSAAIS